MATLREALASGRVLLMDGAMATELHRAGLATGGCPELWNLTAPEQVRSVHRRYVAAGAQCLTTNTFQANPDALARHGLQDQQAEILRAAVALARDASDGRQFLLGSIGPMRLQGEELECVARALAGVDALLLETWSDPEILGTVGRLVDISGLPILMSFTFSGSPGSDPQPALHPSGVGPEQVARRAHQSGVAALGVNCGRDVGMDEVIAIVRAYRRGTDLPLFARPNAGTPAQADGQWVYPRRPADMADRLNDLLAAGVSMVGGCCGTAPAHIAAFRPIVDAWNARRP